MPLIVKTVITWYYSIPNADTEHNRPNNIQVDAKHGFPSEYQPAYKLILIRIRSSRRKKTHQEVQLS